MTRSLPVSTSRRTNEEWLRDLRGGGLANEQAITDLRDFLLRAILVYLTRQRSDLARFELSELEQMAEDWAQQAVLQVLENLASFAGRSRLTTWAYRVAINLVASELRRRRWSDVSLEHLIETTPQEVHNSESRMDLELDYSVARKQIWETISQVMNQELSVRQRTALTQVVLEGVPVDLVAEQLGTNRNNVYKIVHDARKKLRSALEQRHWSGTEVLAIFSASAKQH